MMKHSNWKYKRLWYLLKYVGTILVAIALLGVLLVRYTDWQMAGRILLSLDIIFLAWMIVAVTDKVLRNKWVFVSLFMALMAMGVYVYSRQLENNTKVTESSKQLYPIVNTLSIFFPSRGDYNIEENYDFYYYLLHFLGYFFAAWVLFSLFGKQMISRTLYWVIEKDKINVFWGYSVSGKVLAKNMMEQPEFCQPVFVLPKNMEYNSEEEAMVFDELMDFGAIVLHGDFENMKIKGVRHFFMTERQDDNVSMALKMLDGLKEKLPELDKKTYLHIRTEIEGIDSLFQGKYENNPELKKKVEVALYSQSDLAARSFVMNHPLLDLVGREFKPFDKRMRIHEESATVSGECHVLLLGLGWSGFEILRKTVCDAQFLGNDFHFSVTVIDDDFEKNRGRYLRIFEAARRHGIEINVNPTIFINEAGEIVKEDRGGLMGNVEYHGFIKKNVSSVNGCDFYRWLSFNENILGFDRIIVTLGEDELNTNTAMQLHRFRLSYLNAENAKGEKFMPERIFVHVKDYQSYDFYKNNEKSPILPFGDFGEINSVKVLVKEDIDAVAKMVNYVYCNDKLKELLAEQFEDKKAVEECWDNDDTKIFNQNSSRSVALNVKNTVDIAGGKEKFRIKVRDAYYIEKYADMEHKRWNAFNIMYGVDTWDKDEVTVDNGKLKFGGVLARHICIVDFDELDEMSLKVRSLGKKNADYRETDRRIVRHFPLFYDMMK